MEADGSAMTEFRRKKRELVELPKLPDLPGWGEDTLSNSLQATHVNVLDSYWHDRDWYARLRFIDEIFSDLTANLDHLEIAGTGMFTVRAHGAYIAACRLVLGGQVYETFAQLRSCIEVALYAFYLCRNPDIMERWFKRHDSAEDKKWARNQLRIATMLDDLQAVDKRVGEITRRLYDDTIDFGAHPNPWGVITGATVDESEQDEDVARFAFEYFPGPDSAMRRFAYKWTALTGIAALDIFGVLLPTRFRELEFPIRMAQAKHGL